MSRYLIDTYHDGDKWVAVIPDLLVVGQGEDAATAVNAALTQAQKTESDLIRTNLATHDKSGRLRIRPTVHKGLGTITAEAFIGFGIRASIVGAILLVFYVLVSSDVKSVAREFKNDLIAQIDLMRNAIEGTVPDDQNVSERLRKRAERLREILTPAARELRPIIQMMSADEPRATDKNP